MAEDDLFVEGAFSSQPLSSFSLNTLEDFLLFDDERVKATTKPARKSATLSPYEGAVDLMPLEKPCVTPASLCAEESVQSACCGSFLTPRILLDEAPTLLDTPSFDHQELLASPWPIPLLMESYERDQEEMQDCVPQMFAHMGLFTPRTPHTTVSAPDNVSVVVETPLISAFASPNVALLPEPKFDEVGGESLFPSLETDDEEEEEEDVDTTVRGLFQPIQPALPLTPDYDETSRHSGEVRVSQRDRGKKFTCQHPGCNRRFDRSHNLKTHLLTHTNIKPYVCNLCKRPFRRRYDLTRHVSALHPKNAGAMFACTKCGKRYARKDGLNKHQSVGCLVRKR